MKRIGKKCLSFILALLLAMQGIFMLPGDVKAAGTSEKSAKQPGNPVHHCTKKNNNTDTTDWSYVYFGSYPQTEITENNLTPEIIGASYDENGDAWVNGTKYRRVQKSDVIENSLYHFGNVRYRYFKWERIKWRVLQNNGTTLFVMADAGLDCVKYNEIYETVTWESCTLRQWLDRRFYNTAFSSAEQGAIVEQVVVNEDNPSYGTKGGNDTSDKVYLLSIGEVTNPAYGFCEDFKIRSISRQVKSSDFAYVRGAYTNDIPYLGNCTWRLRSPGKDANCAGTVSYDGKVFREGEDFSSHASVVPVLHINLSSELWSAADDGRNGEEDNQDAENVKVDKLSISAISKKIAAGQKVTLNLDVSPTNAENSKVKWKTGNAKYATVNSRGVVTTKKAGKGKKVKITAETTDGSGKKATIELKLMKNAVIKVQVDKVEKPLQAGKSITLKAKVKTNGKDVNKTLKWSVSNEKYATVNAKGKVTAKKAGKGKTVTVTAMSTDGTGKKAEVKIKIK